MFNDDSLFSHFAKHTSDLDNVIQRIIASERSQGSINVDDDFTEDDLNYIKSMLRKHNISASLNIDD